MNMCKLVVELLLLGATSGVVVVRTAAAG